jgi:hypothetical protein
VVISRQATEICTKRVETCNMRSYGLFRNCVIALSGITRLSRTSTNVDINKDSKGFLLDALVNETQVDNYNNSANNVLLFSITRTKPAPLADLGTRTQK